AIEEALAATRAEAGSAPPTPELPVDPGLREDYLRHLRQLVPGELPLAGLKIVLDAGNGAASSYAGELFASLGAEAVVLHDRPDGRNVNLRCGSTAPGEAAQQT